LKRFTFSLENILKYRQSIEAQERELLARALQKEHLEESRAQELAREKYTCLSTYDVHKSNINNMRQQESYLTSLDLRIENQQQQLNQAKSLSNTLRIKVITATSDRKILENLKERHLEEYQLELSRTQQKILDDVGISSYCRKEQWERR